MDRRWRRCWSRDHAWMVFTRFLSWLPSAASLIQPRNTCPVMAPPTVGCELMCQPAIRKHASKTGPQASLMKFFKWGSVFLDVSSLFEADKNLTHIKVLKEERSDHCRSPRLTFSPWLWVSCSYLRSTNIVFALFCFALIFPNRMHDFICHYSPAGNELFSLAFPGLKQTKKNDTRDCSFHKTERCGERGYKVHFKTHTGSNPGFPPSKHHTDKEWSVPMAITRMSNFWGCQKMILHGKLMLWLLGVFALTSVMKKHQSHQRPSCLLPP